MTFDDTFTLQWLAAAPIFKRYAARVTFFVSNAGGLKPRQIEDLKQLQKMGHAIACHGLHHKKAVDFVTAHGMREYVLQEIEPANAALTKIGFAPSSFAYPSSQRNPQTDTELLKHFRHLRCGISTEPGQQLKDLDAIFVPYAAIAKTGCLMSAGIDSTGTAKSPRPDSLRQVLEALDRARNRREIVVLYAHNISTDHPSHHLQPIVLGQILAHAQTIGLPAVTYDDLP